MSDPAVQFHRDAASLVEGVAVLNPGPAHHAFLPAAR